MRFSRLGGILGTQLVLYQDIVELNLLPLTNWRQESFRRTYAGGPTEKALLLLEAKCHFLPSIGGRIAQRSQKHKTLPTIWQAIGVVGKSIRITSSFVTTAIRIYRKHSMTPSRIAFGSCNEQSRENKMWSIIESRKPAAFVWGGDSIYAGKKTSSSIWQ